MGKGYKGRNPRGGKRETDAQAEAEFLARRGGGGGGQSSTVGMLPPSDSEEDEEEPKPKAPPQPQPAGGQPKTAGLMPPSDSDDEDSDSSDGSEPEYLKQAVVRKPKDAPVERSAEDIRKELERLEIIRKKREDDKQKRIAAEGWDRFAPVSETNKPPGHQVPSDHPSRKT